MSRRSIAPIVGTTYQQVAKDRQVSHQATPDLPADDGYPNLLPEPDEDDEPVEVYQSFSRDAELIEPVKVTGMDGRQYTRPTPRIRG